MKDVLVDTSIWSQALRRDHSNDVAAVLSDLIDQSRVQMIGPIRQELLSGIKSQQQFERLREQLRSFPDLEINTADYELAAQFFNQCREKGIQGSHIDFLICAVASSHDLEIYTLDQDFQQYAKHLSVHLFIP